MSSAGGAGSIYLYTLSLLEAIFIHCVTTCHYERKTATEDCACSAVYDRVTAIWGNVVGCRRWSAEVVGVTEVDSRGGVVVGKGGRHGWSVCVDGVGLGWRGELQVVVGPGEEVNCRWGGGVRLGWSTWMDWWSGWSVCGGLRWNMCGGGVYAAVECRLYGPTYYYLRYLLARYYRREWGGIC